MLNVVCDREIHTKKLYNFYITISECLILKSICVGYLNFHININFQKIFLKVVDQFNSNFVSLFCIMQHTQQKNHKIVTIIVYANFKFSNTLSQCTLIENMLFDLHILNVQFDKRAPCNFLIFNLTKFLHILIVSRVGLQER